MSDSSETGILRYLAIAVGLFIAGWIGLFVDTAFGVVSFDPARWDPMTAEAIGLTVVWTPGMMVMVAIAAPVLIRKMEVWSA